MSAVVQSKTVAASGVSPTTSLAFTSNVTAGTMLYMLTPISNGTTPIVSSVTDTLGNTWSQLKAALSPDFDMELWTASSGTAGACTVSVNFSAQTANSGCVSVIEVSGQTSPTLGPSATDNETVAANPCLCASVSMTRAGIVFCAWRMQTAVTFSAWNGGFTDLGGASRAENGYLIVSGAATASPSVTANTASKGESLTVGVYDAAAGGGGGVTVRQYRMGLMGVQ